MTNKPKAPQNNTGKHLTSLTATQALALSQTHNNSCSRAHYCHIFSKDAKPKTYTPLTFDLELTRYACEAFRAFPMTVCTRQQIAGQRHLRWPQRLVCVMVQLPRSGNTEALGWLVLLRPLIRTDAPGVDMPFNLHLKWETGHRCSGMGLWFVLWSIWNHASFRRE